LQTVSFISVGDRAFYETGLKGITLPNSAEYLGDSCFCSCGSLMVVALGSGLKGIGKYAFQGTAVKEVTLPQSVGDVGDYCFSSCTQLEKVAFQNPLSSRLSQIGSSAFGSSALRQIDIPNSVVALQGSCFAQCRPLERVCFGADFQLARIEARVFAGCPLRELRLPSDIQFIGVDAIPEAAKVSLVGAVFNLRGFRAPEQTVCWIALSRAGQRRKRLGHSKGRAR
jgi:hypothetical protein